MRLAFLGTPDFALPTLAALLDAGHDVARVYSQPAAPSGRGRASRPSAVARFAERRGLPLATPPRLGEADASGAFADLALDAAVVVAFGQILPTAVLEAPAIGSFNLHASLLPRWRGAAPIHRAIIAGDAVTGVQVMRMTAGLDEGPILASHVTRIDALETAGTLHDRLAHAGAALMVETLVSLERGEARETPQDAAGATYARKIRPAETRLDWRRPATRLDRQIRGLSPAPGAWFLAPSDRGAVRIKALLSRAEEGSGTPGEVLGPGLLVACGEGAVRILRAQREGRAAADAEDFLRGFPLPPGTVL